MTYRVQLIAPSSGIADAENGLEQSVALLTKHNFIVKKPKSDICINLHFYANTVEKRLEDLRAALLDPDVDIIWMFRGGYGASEVAIECLEIKPSHPKILIGFSDGTVLHTLFNEHYKMPSIHGSGCSSLLGKQAKHIDDIMAILNGSDTEVALHPLTKAAHGFKLTSTITGGNLTVLATLIGTKLHPVTKNKILLLEDVSERGYSVRRDLNHLSQAALLDEVSALVLGDFTESDEHLDFAIEDFCSRNEHIPIFRVSGIGHGDTNTPIVFGSRATINEGLLKASSPFGH